MFTQKVPSKFNCEKCDYHTNKLSQWERHINTPKHVRFTDVNKKSSEKKFYFCDCGRKYTYRQSLCRHRKTCTNSQMLTNADKMLTNASYNFKCECGNVYTHRQSLHKHKKTCNANQSNIQCNSITENSIQQLISTLNNVIPKLENNLNNNVSNINSHNNIINVQMFLNDKCADAMSIQNFAKQLCVTMDDLTKNKMDCLTNIVLKNLRPLSLTERPFHCTNVNTKAWFVKDENQGWEEDNGEKLIKNAEIGIQKKWLNEFESQYPNWMSNDAQKDKYVQIAGSASSELPEKIKLKILRELSEEVPLSKEIIIC